MSQEEGDLENYAYIGVSMRTSSHKEYKLKKENFVFKK